MNRAPSGKPYEECSVDEQAEYFTINYVRKRFALGTLRYPNGTRNPDGDLTLKQLAKRRIRQARLGR